MNTIKYEIIFLFIKKKEKVSVHRTTSCATAKTCWKFSIKISRFKSQIFSILALCINTSNVMLFSVKLSTLVHVDSGLMLICRHVF